MNIILGIFGLYVAYFVVMIIYDAFIAKPIAKGKAGTNDVETENISLEDHETPSADEVQNVTFESMQGSNSQSLDLDNVAEKTESEMLIETQKRNEQEDYINNVPVQSEKENLSLNKEADNNSFIMGFSKLLKADNQNVRNVEKINEDVDVLNFINNSTKISSFSYSKHKMMA